MRHAYSVVSTVLEAARLVRHSMDQFIPSLAAQGLRFDVEDLAGACGIASYALHRVLTQLDVRNDFVMGRYHKKWDRGQHCWVDVLSPNLRIDVTATQFDIPASVHVTSLEDDQYRFQWRNGTAIRRLRDWDDQSHTRNKADLDRIIRDVVDQLEESGFVSFGGDAE